MRLDNLQALIFFRTLTDDAVLNLDALGYQACDRLYRIGDTFFFDESSDGYESFWLSRLKYRKGT